MPELYRMGCKFPYNQSTAVRAVAWRYACPSLHKRTDAMSSILVTGAGSGIGAGIARGMAASGHALIVTDLDPDAARGIAEQIVSDGGRAHAMALDVTSDSSVDDLVSQLEAPVDVLVNNAGLQHVAALEDFPPEKWQQLIDVKIGRASCRERGGRAGGRRAG